MATESPSQSLSEENIHVELTKDHLNVLSVMGRVRSPKAGAIVFFAGWTLSPSRLQGLEWKFGRAC